MSVKKSTNAEDVYRAVVEKIGLSKNVSKYFYIFEIVEYNFGMKDCLRTYFISVTVSKDWL